MCRNRRDVVASAPHPRRRPQPRPSPRASASSSAAPSSSSAPAASSSAPVATSSARSDLTALFSTSSSSTSLHDLRLSLRDKGPILYSFTEILAATNSFLSPPLSSSSSSWRCSLRGADATVVRRPFRGDAAALPARLAALCRSNHTAVARLLGASLAGDHLYLVYEYVPGATLADCLRNPRNPSFSPLSSWLSRVQVAADLAQGLEYIHHYSAGTSTQSPAPPERRRPRGTVHDRIKSSAVIVTEHGFRAKICHLGAAELAGDVPVDDEETESGEIASASTPRRSETRATRIEGTRGYIAPELIAGGRISRRSDVFAFGVVLLELLSGEEPLRYRYDRESGGLERISIIETARRAAEEEEVEERYMRVRGWVDRRLRDSFPVEAAEKLIQVALRCVEAEAEAGRRPDMIWVAGKLSKQLIEAKAWDEKVRVPADFSVSLAPR
ncbi:lysM domain receptor-like kinase 3 [Phoenix dactylifera]|uniref:LysM domain receptor-like kinase 3 n=1 Tax=Phoenix dactylifera TaxID=42345 RepID=A0A8B7BF88_PHODC|nr:lysM domain receptor-like kinase 3 [Phoenix dactylifera]